MIWSRQWRTLWHSWRNRVSCQERPSDNSSALCPTNWAVNRGNRRKLTAKRWILKNSVGTKFSLKNWSYPATYETKSRVFVNAFLCWSFGSRCLTYWLMQWRRFPSTLHKEFRWSPEVWRLSALMKPAPPLRYYLPHTDGRHGMEEFRVLFDNNYIRLQHFQKMYLWCYDFYLQEEASLLFVHISLSLLHMAVNKSEESKKEMQSAASTIVGGVSNLLNNPSNVSHLASQPLLMGLEEVGWFSGTVGFCSSWEYFSHLFLEYLILKNVMSYFFCRKTSLMLFLLSWKISRVHCWHSKIITGGRLLSGKRILLFLSIGKFNLKAWRTLINSPGRYL